MVLREDLAMIVLASRAQVLALKNDRPGLDDSLPEILHARSTAGVRTSNVRAHLSNDLQEKKVLLG